MKWITYFLLAVLGIWFALMGFFNHQSVVFNYALATIELPLFFIALISFAAGAVLATLLFGLRAVLYQSRANSLERQLDREHDELKKAKIREQFEQEIQQEVSR